jgi:hypothetical protein
MIRNIKVFIIAFAVMMIAATSAQAHTVTISPKGKVSVYGGNPTTRIESSKHGSYVRTVVTTKMQKVRLDLATEVIKQTTTVDVRVKKCPKGTKRCVQQKKKDRYRIIAVVPAPKEQAANLQPAPEVQSQPDRVYTTLALSCTLPTAWITPVPVGLDYTQMGDIWCQATHDEDDPVRLEAVSPDVQPSRFTSANAYEYARQCPADRSCFNATYNLAAPGSYSFRVTATTESGQQATFEGTAQIIEGYPTDGFK